MSSPPVIAFVGTVLRAETTLAWLGCGAHLAQAGFRVLLVDATLDGFVGRLLPQLGEAAPDGSPLAELLSNPGARPALLNVLKPFRTLFGRDLARSELVMLPGLRSGEPPRPDLVNPQKPALQSRWRDAVQAVRGLRYQDRAFDLTLWLLPPSVTAPSRIVAGSFSDVVVKVRPPPATPLTPTELPDPEDFPGEGPLINAYVVRGELSARRGTAIHLPALGPEADESAALYLARGSVQRGLEAMVRGVREYLETRPFEQKLAFLTAVAEADAERAQACFAQLWAADFAEALDLFDTEVAPRAGSMLAAMAALRAVRAAPQKRLWDIRHLATMALQKLRWSEARPESEEILDAYEHLRAASDAGAELPNPARLLIDAADAMNHAANWRKHQGAEGVGELAAKALELLRAADELERRPGDCARWAWAAANNARLTGSSDLLGRVRVALAIWAEAAPIQHIRTRARVLGDFALITSDAALWQEVRDLCDAMRTSYPGDALYCAAIACGHLGRLGEGYGLLAELYVADRAQYFQAFRDPDMAPLWRGLGQQDYPLLLPGPLLH